VQLRRNPTTGAGSRPGRSRGLRVALAGATCGALVATGITVASSPALAARKLSNVPLIVYSAQGYDQAMVKAFQNATGILTELDTNSTGPLLAQIQASKNNPHWGLLWVDGQTGFAELDDEHMLVRGFEPPKVHWNSLGKAVLPKDGSFVPTGITFMGGVAYTSKVVKDPPTSWNTLLSAKWKGAVGMNTPTQSGPTYPFIAGIMNYLGSVTKGKQFFEKLKANGLVIHTTNGPTLAALASGQIKLALVQSSAAIGARHTDPNLRIKYLNPITELPSNIGIDAMMTKTEISEAKQFAEFVLSKTGQTVMKAGTPTGDSLYYPVVQGITPRPELPALSSTVKIQHTDPYTWGPREASINSWFVNNITK
jgi:iron(III) transport system substrate-binding protein